MDVMGPCHGTVEPIGSHVGLYIIWVFLNVVYK